MIYLRGFQLLNEKEESDFFLFQEKRTCFNNTYPFKLFSEKQLENIKFDSINIFYGGNGSGKSTILNIIAEKLNAERNQEFSKGTFFDRYVEKCNFELAHDKPEIIKIVTSDDVFDYLFDIRSINNHIEKNRNELFDEYLKLKYSSNGNSFSDYETLKKTVDTRKKTMSRYVRERLTKNNIIEQSNGESALMYFENEIKENAIYILDEPENSLSAESQLKLVKFIEESVRFYNCQFIISTHSPFLLSMCDAKIFDLDSTPVKIKKWTELGNVKVYYNFFKEHENEFYDNE